MTARILVSGVLAVFGFCSVAPILAQSDRVAPALIEKSAQANFSEFIEMLSLPNDSIIGEDIRKNAEWLEVAFRKRGFETRQLPNNGKSLVFAEYARKNPNARTILFYIHFDGMPVIPAQWSQKSPWTAVLKQRVANSGPTPPPTFTPSRVSAQPF
jgi:acetylornithine deacetylase/succinyl-diaminopimelate desuccinylase-like protein